MCSSRGCPLGAGCCYTQSYPGLKLRFLVGLIDSPAPGQTDQTGIYHAAAQMNRCFAATPGAQSVAG